MVYSYNLRRNITRSENLSLQINNEFALKPKRAIYSIMKMKEAVILIFYFIFHLARFFIPIARIRKIFFGVRNSTILIQSGHES